MADQLGSESKLYLGSGSWGSPTWAEQTTVVDVNLDPGFTQGDVSKRKHAGWTRMKTGWKDPTLTVKYLYDPADSQFVAMRTAFTAQTALMLAVADGAIATTGTWYFKADWNISAFPINQVLKEFQEVEITFKLADTANTPTFTTVT